MAATRSTRLEGLHCTIAIEEAAPSVVLVTIEGTDVGELGDTPFRVLESIIAADQHAKLFVDARRARGASIEVSKDWALWLVRHRSRVRHVDMLTANRFVRLTADFVRRFTDLGDAMHLYSEPDAFEGALSEAVDGAHGRAG
jgi:hypothetical protein